VDGKRLAALLSKYRRDRDGVANHSSIGQILIVEDDVVTRTLRRILEKPGWAVVLTTDGLLCNS
jgi:argininosuccinate synthase